MDEMSAKKFVIGEFKNKDVAVRILLGLILLVLVSITFIIGFYLFRTKIEETVEGCGRPSLDPLGLSNWTAGAQTSIFGCPPGYLVDGHKDQLIVSQCLKAAWSPPPPICALLPIALECTVNINGLQGNISMWQKSTDSVTLIHGYLNTSGIDTSKTIFMETVKLSMESCKHVSGELNNCTLPPLIPVDELGEDQLEVRFRSKLLAAYKPAYLRLTMIFIDTTSKLIATIISVHQANQTLIMKVPLPIPSPSVGWSYNTEIKHPTQELVTKTSNYGDKQAVDRFPQPRKSSTQFKDFVNSNKQIQDTVTLLREQGKATEEGRNENAQIGQLPYSPPHFSSNPDADGFQN